MIDINKIEQICNNKNIKNIKIINALKNVDRTIFIDPSLHKFAFDDVTLPIGFGQTISTISTVGIMLENLNIKKNDKVLEIGTGCGYACSVASHLSDFVFSIERIKELHLFAKNILLKQKIYHVKLKHDDGVFGLFDDKMIFDKIFFSCACPDIPVWLFDKLSENGVAVLPIGDDDFQELIIINKKDGDLEITSLGETKFVPMIEGVN